MLFCNQMRKKQKTGLLFFGLVLCAACLSAFHSKQQSTFIQNKTNPETTQKISQVQLGRLLFYDPSLSRDSTISCASCHSPYNAFAHSDHALSHGINDRIGKRNAPALQNLQHHPNFMWDGAIHHLDFQGLVPLTHPDEMGQHPDSLYKRLNRSAFYKKHFYNCWGDSLITGEHLLKSFSAFLLTLQSNHSKYDSVSMGLVQFTPIQEKGHRIFIEHCEKCHKEPQMSDFSFSNNGLKPDPILQDIGRSAITGVSADSFKFKVPSLRNIEYSAPYMHDGRFKQLRQVLDHYTRIDTSIQGLDSRLSRKIRLSENEKTELISFLLCLGDKSYIFNKNLGPPPLSDYAKE